MAQAVEAEEMDSENTEQVRQIVSRLKDLGFLDLEDVFRWIRGTAVECNDCKEIFHRDDITYVEDPEGDGAWLLELCGECAKKRGK